MPIEYIQLTFTLARFFSIKEKVGEWSSTYAQRVGAQARARPSGLASNETGKHSHRIDQQRGTTGERSSSFDPPWFQGPIARANHIGYEPFGFELKTLALIPTINAMIQPLKYLKHRLGLYLADLFNVPTYL